MIEDKTVVLRAFPKARIARKHNWFAIYTDNPRQDPSARVLTTGNTEQEAWRNAAVQLETGRGE